MRRKLTAWISSVVVVAAFVTACYKPATQPPENGSPAAVELRQEWFPYSGFAGEVSAAKRFAKDQQIDLKITPGSEEVDPIKLVLSGSADFGVVGGDLLVAAVAKGAPLVAIGVINYKSPTCFIVHANSGIKGPNDFIGKRVGILPGTNTERVYQLMMKRAGVDRSKVKETPVPFELQTFILGQYDVRPAFIYDETVSLEQQKIPYEVIDPSKFGVNFTGTVYFTRRDVIEKKRDLVQKLVSTLAKGWDFALKNPDDAIQDLVGAYPDLKADRERRSLELAKPYFSGEDGKPLYASAQTWSAMIKGLEEIGVITSNSVRVEQVWDDSFVRRIYEQH
jgi:ABC-type nitrate/sulfonate/bicarbonate transport system substrate-binding protein